MRINKIEFISVGIIMFVVGFIIGWFIGQPIIDLENNVEVKLDCNDLQNLLTNQKIQGK